MEDEEQSSGSMWGGIWAPNDIGAAIGLTSLSLNHNAQSLCDHGVMLLVRATGQTLKSLSLRGNYQVTDASLLSISAECLRLVDLDVSGCSISNEGVRPVVDRCIRLTTLQAESCNGVCGRAFATTDDSLDRTRSNSKGKRRGGPKQLAIVGENSCMLTTLDLRSCHRVSDMSLHYISIAMSVSLRRLDIRYCTLVTTAGVMVLAKACHGLESLLIDGATMTDIGVQCLSTNCRCLSTLSLAGCGRISNKSLLAIAGEWIPKGAQSIFLSTKEWASDISLIDRPRDPQDKLRWGEDRPEMKSALRRALQYAATKHERTEIMQHARAGCTPDQIMWIAQRVRDEAVSLATAMKKKLSGLRHITALDVSGNTMITDEGIVCIAERCGKSLREIQLKHNAYVGDKSVIALGQCCHVLEVLSFREIGGGLEDESLECLVRGCVDLKCARFTPLKEGKGSLESHPLSVSLRGLSALLQCERLEELQLESDAIRARQFVSVSWPRLFPTLHTLRLSGCTNLPADVVRSIVNAAPRLRTCDLSFSLVAVPDVISMVLTTKYVQLAKEFLGFEPLDNRQVEYQDKYFLNYTAHVTSARVIQRGFRAEMLRRWRERSAMLIQAFVRSRRARRLFERSLEERWRRRAEWCARR